MVDVYRDITYFVNYTYDSTNQRFVIHYRSFKTANFYNDFLCILVDRIDRHIYIYLNFVDNTIKFNEINEGEMMEYPLTTTTGYNAIVSI